eukprot:1178605-Prorocentrum_minimum.AAC.2
MARGARTLGTFVDGSRVSAGLSYGLDWRFSRAQLGRIGVDGRNECGLRQCSSCGAPLATEGGHDIGWYNGGCSACPQMMLAKGAVLWNRKQGFCLNRHADANATLLPLAKDKEHRHRINH